MSDYRVDAATKEEWAERAMVAEAKLAKLEVRLRVAMDTLRYYNLEVRTPRDPAQHAADMRILKTKGETE